MSTCKTVRFLMLLLGIVIMYSTCKKPEPEVILTLTANPSTEQNIAAEGNKFTIAITATTSWTVSCSEAWLTPDPISGSNNGSIKINYAANAATTERTAKVTIKGKSVADVVISVKQAGRTLARPTATTNAATGISKATASLNGSVSANNISTSVTFEYGTTTSYGTTAIASPVTVLGNTATTVSANISG